MSKLSSQQEKHKDDLRVLAAKLDKEITRRRRFDHGRAFLDDHRQRPQMEANWQFIFQEPLLPPTDKPEAPAARPRRKRGNTRRKHGG